MNNETTATLKYYSNFDKIPKNQTFLYNDLKILMDELYNIFDRYKTNHKIKIFA